MMYGLVVFYESLFHVRFAIAVIACAIVVLLCFCVTASGHLCLLSAALLKGMFRSP